jgi:hypothetical protein
MPEHTTRGGTCGAAKAAYGLSPVYECFVHCGMDRQEFRQPRDLHHRAALFRKSCQRKGLAMVSSVDKELHERPHSCGVQKRYAAQIKYEVRCRLRPQGLDEIVDGLEAKFPVEPHYHLTAVGTRQLFQRGRVVEGATTSPPRFDKSLRPRHPTPAMIHPALPPLQRDVHTHPFLLDREPARSGKALDRPKACHP